MIEKLKESTRFLRSQLGKKPEIGMITGTGLGSLTQGLSKPLRIPYEDIPNFPRSTTQGHAGELVFGMIAGKTVVAMDGRFHMYEGYSAEEVTFPVRVLAMLGIQILLISSAAGGLNPQFDKGDLMIVSDHINLTGANPLIGPNLNELGPRFPDMSKAYDSGLILLGKKIALDLKIPLRQGVYAGVLGPSLETPAETRFFRNIGADAVGMSTVLEAIVAVHCGLRIMAIVVLTNINLSDCMEKTTIEEVIASAQQSGKTLSLLWEKIIGGISA
ncbi:Purine nucleoside phosphorylase 1 [uncultured Desulfobacterium sp.]|uniref:Purine nucleoside phosphorylase n=1 Tax=uncultured Desulfobacterium sp. TaxID=201089 RepID=A0A445N2W5_9BACT|nr:Purine nucleoside phosphorylase 1 [uncultured Desulfobacterium sp.]